MHKRKIDCNQVNLAYGLNNIQWKKYFELLGTIVSVKVSSFELFSHEFNYFAFFLQFFPIFNLFTYRTQLTQQINANENSRRFKSGRIRRILFSDYLILNWSCGTKPNETCVFDLMPTLTLSRWFNIQIDFVKSMKHYYNNDVSTFDHFYRFCFEQRDVWRIKSPSNEYKNSSPNRLKQKHSRTHKFDSWVFSCLYLKAIMAFTSD